jgi:hypothetical protein
MPGRPPPHPFASPHCDAAQEDAILLDVDTDFTELPRISLWATVEVIRRLPSATKAQKPARRASAGRAPLVRAIKSTFRFAFDRSVRTIDQDSHLHVSSSFMLLRNPDELAHAAPPPSSPERAELAEAIRVAAEAAIETAATAHLVAVAAGKAGPPPQTIREARNNLADAVDDLTTAEGARSELRSEWTRLQETWKVGA